MDNGAAGTRAQTAGLASAVSRLCGGAEIVARTVRVSAAAKIAPRLVAQFMRVKSGDSPPELIIACGGDAAAAALAARRDTGAFTVFAQKPPVSAAAFDAVICPQHDNFGGENVLPILGSAGADGEEIARRREAARQKFSALPNPKTGVLIGGGSRAYRMTPQFCRALAEGILAADSSGGVLATASRRTGAENIRELSAAFGGGGCFFYAGGGAENPYPDILSAADRFVVSGDSANMLSEASAAGKPVHIAAPPEKSPRRAEKFRRFHDALVARGTARYWRGAFEDWTPTPLRETARAAEFIWTRYCAARRK